NAINQSCTGDSIWVAQGTYLPIRPADNLYVVDTANRDNAFVLRNGVKIFGGFNGTETSFSQRNWTINPTILSGEMQQDNDSSNNAYHVVIAYYTDSSTLLDGFTIQEGESNGSGYISIGGVICYRSEGGGIYTHTSSSIFSNLIIQNNFADVGGAGINAIFNTNALYSHLLVQNNSTNNQGGGIRVYGGSIYLQQSTIS